MKLRKHLCTLLALGLTTLTISGCAFGDRNHTTTVAVDENGAVTETIVETAEDDFTEDELESYINQTISEYDGEESAVSLDSCDADGSKIKIVMKYSTVQDYSDFNQVPAFLGTIQEASEAGFDMDQAFKDRSGDPADMEVIKARAKEWKVLIVSEAVSVRVPDKILYTTDNVSITGRLTANVDTVMNDEDNAENVADSGKETSADSTTDTSVSSTSETEDLHLAEEEEERALVQKYTTVADKYAYIIYK